MSGEARLSRRALTALAALSALALAAWAALAPSAPLPARFAVEDCRRVAGEIVGAEDLAQAPDGRVLFSAYDRRAEEEARSEGRRPPDGGLYALDPTGESAPAQLIAPQALPFGLRPHGIALDGARLALVNRGYEQTAEGWRRRTAIELFDWADGAPRWRARFEAPEFCAANDLAFDGPRRLLVTLDRGGCARSWRETLFAGGGALLALDLDDGRIKTLRRGLDFANGVLSLPQGWRVAETRGDRIATPGGALATPGGPDNLTRDGDGVVAALHPDLPRLALYRGGWVGAAPSRAARIGPDGETEILFEDREGRFSAATAALLSGERLILGSALDRGLLVCGGGA